MFRATCSGGRLNRVFVSMAAVLGLVAGACGSGTDDEASADGGGAKDDFCAQLEAASEDEALASGDDPAEAAAAAQELRSLAAGAPEEVAGAITVIADVLDELSELDQSGEGDVEDFGRMMALMFDPEIIKASEVLEDYAVSECGFDPEDAAERFGSGSGASAGIDSDPGTDEDLDPGDLSGSDEDSGSDADSGSDEVGTSAGREISLEDLDEVGEQHGDASWSDKIVSSGVVNDSIVELYGKGPDDEYIEREPLTVQEAVEACEAVREAFGSEQPALEVHVGNGDTVLVEGTASEACAAV